jgi:dihydroorotase
VHICHVSTAGSVEIVRWAKAKGCAVTAEVTPHHLLLTDDLLTGYDPVYKVNPPLRPPRTWRRCAQALADGTIDIVATDHAPHTVRTRSASGHRAAFGMLGLETALRWCWTTMVAAMRIWGAAG